MTEAPISPLRRRMIEDMTMRKFSPRTQEGYIRAVKSFSAFLGASPDTASFEDLRRHQLHLVSTASVRRPSTTPRPRCGSCSW
jgi:integrase/recombinase XerD